MSLSAALQRILLQELKSKSRNAEIFETLYQPFIGIQVTARAVGGHFGFEKNAFLLSPKT